MIPGLLDSQIKKMSGREIAKRLIGVVVLPSLRMPSDMAAKSEWDKYERRKGEYAKTLGDLIDDIRAADKA